MDTEKGAQLPRKTVGAASSSQQYYLKTFNASLNMLCHILVGIVVGVVIAFVFRQTLPLSVTHIHIILCVFGYQLLMAEAILSLSPHNGWSNHLRLVDKRRAHTILQVVGSVLAIVGSFLKIADKAYHGNPNWSSTHGIFGLIALVFTVCSLINGGAALYANELRRFLPPQLSKITHICSGVIAFVAAGICLCYGFEKNMFRGWIGANSDPIVNTMITFTALLTSTIIVAPLITFFTKLKIF